MPRIQVTELDGQVVYIDGALGETLMEALKNGGCDDIEAICGGACSCSSCHVYVAPQWLEAVGERNEGEQQLLAESDYLQGNSRLACQVVLTAALENLQVVVAPPEG